MSQIRNKTLTADLRGREQAYNGLKDLIDDLAENKGEAKQAIEKVQDENRKISEAREAELERVRAEKEKLLQELERRDAEKRTSMASDQQIVNEIRGELEGSVREVRAERDRSVSAHSRLRARVRVYFILISCDYFCCEIQREVERREQV